MRKVLFFPFVSPRSENLPLGILNTPDTSKSVIKSKLLLQKLRDGKDSRDEGVSPKTNIGFSLGRKFPPDPYN